MHHRVREDVVYPNAARTREQPALPIGREYNRTRTSAVRKLSNLRASGAAIERVEANGTVSWAGHRELVRAWNERNLVAIAVRREFNGAGSRHAAQINDEERWKIILYVQSLQGNDIVNNADVVAESSTGTEAQTTN